MFADAGEGLEAGASVFEEEAWYCVDEAKDLARLKAELRVCPDVAPRAVVMKDL